MLINKLSKPLFGKKMFLMGLDESCYRDSVRGIFYGQKTDVSFKKSTGTKGVKVVEKPQKTITRTEISESLLEKILPRSVYFDCAVAMKKEREALIRVSYERDNCYDSDLMKNLQSNYNYKKSKLQSFYKQEMTKLYSEEGIVNLMENPEAFFERGWVYPTLKKFSINQYYDQEDSVIGSGTEWATALPEEFFENPENLKSFYECAGKYWNDIINQNEFSKYQLEELFSYMLGFKIFALRCRQTAMGSLQEKIRENNPNKDVLIQNFRKLKNLPKFNCQAYNLVYDTCVLPAKEKTKKETANERVGVEN